MKPFALSERSLSRLEGVNRELVNVVTDAIKISTIDFGVVQGLRTPAEQAALVAKGASKTMKSKHLDGLAVDLMAYLNGRASWELTLYDNIADAMRKAAIANNLPLRWGAAWHKPLTEWDGSAEDLMNEYIDLRRSQGKRPFIDAPHFEMLL